MGQCREYAKATMIAIDSKANAIMIVGRGRSRGRGSIGDAILCVYVTAISGVARLSLPKVVQASTIPATEKRTRISALPLHRSFLQPQLGGPVQFLPGARRLKINMEGPNEDFKGFEDGFSGFPKHLPEDCVEYCIYVIDSKLSPKEILGELETVRKESLKLIDDLLTEYIWQRESFKLDLESGKGML